MLTIKGKMFYEPNELGVFEPYIMLNDNYLDDDGSLNKIIKSKNIGVTKDGIYMDMPIMYNKLNPVTLNILKKNNFNCEVEIDTNHKLKKIDDLVIIVIK